MKILTVMISILTVALTAHAETDLQKSNSQILGVYVAETNICPDQLQACDNATVEADDTGRLWAKFGRAGALGIPAKMLALPMGTEINSAYLFNTFQLPEHCDFSGCEKIKRIAGVLYTKPEGRAPIKLRVTVYLEDPTYQPRPNEAGRPYKFEMQKVQ